MFKKTLHSQKKEEDAIQNTLYNYWESLLGWVKYMVSKINIFNWKTRKWNQGYTQVYREKYKDTKYEKKMQRVNSGFLAQH